MNTYTGGTRVEDGRLQLGVDNALASTGALTVNGGTFALNGHNQTVGTLSGTGGSIALGGNTLTTNSASTSSYAGSLLGSGGLGKQGAGTLILTGTNTYSGTTTISAGTLQVGAGGTTGTLGTGVVTEQRHAALQPIGQHHGRQPDLRHRRVDQAGSGTTTLTGTNTYSGTTTISAGTLSDRRRRHDAALWAPATSSTTARWSSTVRRSGSRQRHLRHRRRSAKAAPVHHA